MIEGGAAGGVDVEAAVDGTVSAEDGAVGAADGTVGAAEGTVGASGAPAVRRPRASARPLVGLAASVVVHAAAMFGVLLLPRGAPLTPLIVDLTRDDAAAKALPREHPAPVPRTSRAVSAPQAPVPSSARRETSNAHSTGQAPLTTSPESSAAVPRPAVEARGSPPPGAEARSLPERPASAPSRVPTPEAPRPLVAPESPPTPPAGPEPAASAVSSTRPPEGRRPLPAPELAPAPLSAAPRPPAAQPLPDPPIIPQPTSPPEASEPVAAPSVPPLRTAPPRRSAQLPRGLGPSPGPVSPATVAASPPPMIASRSDAAGGTPEQPVTGAGAADAESSAASTHAPGAPGTAAGNEADDVDAGPDLARAAPDEDAAGEGPEYGAYLERLRTRVQQVLRYPSSARRRGLEGTVTLELTLEPSGSVVEVTVVESSSHAVLDRAAVDAIRLLRPQPFSGGAARRVLRVRLPVVFELR